MTKYPISHFEGRRAANELVIYREGKSSQTNKYGFEVCVDKNGFVISCGGNNNIIPEKGFVVSAHGEAAIFLADAVCVGAEAVIDGNMLLIRIDEETKDRDAEERIELIKNRARQLKDYDKEATDQILKQAINAKNEKDFEKVKLLTEEAYYLTSLSVSEETRAVWHRPLEKNKEEVETTVKRFANAGFNLLLIETNYSGYANAIKCAKDYLPARSDFDVIDAFISIAHKYGLKVHSWYENYFVGHTELKCAMLDYYPQWIAHRKDGSILLDADDKFYFLNAAMPEVRQHLVSSCRELLDNYDFDGLQLDYIRYPLIKDIHHAAGFDDYTKNAFLQETGIDIEKIESTESAQWISFTEWCAKQVTIYVEMIHSLISEYRAKGRDIQLTTAVIGDPEDAIHKKCQDWRYWIEQGWLDAIYPMAYYNDASEVEKEVSNMVRNYSQTPNISGISPMYNHLPIQEATKQVEACRKAGAKGIAFFAAESFTDECLETLGKGVFRNR